MTNQVRKLSSANTKKSHDALRPEEARWRQVDAERDLAAEAPDENYEGAPGLVDDDRSAGTKGTDDKRPPAPRR